MHAYNNKLKNKIYLLIGVGYSHIETLCHLSGTWYEIIQIYQKKVRSFIIKTL